MNAAQHWCATTGPELVEAMRRRLATLEADLARIDDMRDEIALLKRTIVAADSVQQQPRAR